MIKVKFTYSDEFLSDMEKDEALIDHRIVRITGLRERGGSPIPLSNLYVIASYVVDGQIVSLKHFVGNLPGFNKEADDAIWERAKAIGDQIEAKVTKLGLQARHGCFECDNAG